MDSRRVLSCTSPLLYCITLNNGIQWQHSQRPATYDCIVSIFCLIVFHLNSAIKNRKKPKLYENKILFVQLVKIGTTIHSVWSTLFFGT